MRRRERIDFLLSLFIYFLAWVLLATSLSGCINPDHRKGWIGQWQDGVWSDYWKFKRDGTWDKKDSNGDWIYNGTYSVDKSTFRMTSIHSNHVFSGKWERMADKLVLYINNIPGDVDMLGNPVPPQVAIVFQRLN